MRRKTVTFIFILLGSFLLLANNVFSQSIKCDVNKLKVVKFNEHSQAVGELQKCLNSLGFSIKSGITNFFGRENSTGSEKFL